MKDKRLIIILGIVAVVVILGCCAASIIGILIFSGSSKPDHHGVYLKQGRSFAEMQLYRGAPGLTDTNGIPSTSEARPTLVLWEPTIDLRYLELYEISSEWYIDYTTAASGDMIEVTPRSDLGPGRYCFVQGDPLGFPGTLSHWCFDVE